MMSRLFGESHGDQKARCLRQRHLFALVLLLLLLGLHAAASIPLLSPSPYNSYTLQAMAWHEGQAHLPEDVPHLELAIKDGRYYVSFPPAPSIPIYLLTFIFGDRVPDGLLVKLYVIIAYYALCRLLTRSGWREGRAAAMAFLLCTASAMLPLLLSGAVWYQAQVMAFMWTVLAIDALFGNKPTSGLLFYALAVGCRPFNALYGPLIMGLYMFRSQDKWHAWSLRQCLKTLLPGIAVGLSVAAAYAWYNMLRFGHPLEFGHNYLPEFSFQGGKQFSFSHIPNNIKNYVFSLPFDHSGDTLALKRFGFSLFLATPILLMLIYWAVRDGITKQLSGGKLPILFTILLHLLLLLSHRTFGGFQYGARYAVDLIPYAVLYLVLDHADDKWTKPLVVIMTLGLCLAIYGSLVIVLPQ